MHACNNYDNYFNNTFGASSIAGVLLVAYATAAATDDCPTICTSEYRPVCAKNSAGEYKTFATNCNLRALNCVKKTGEKKTTVCRSRNDSRLLIFFRLRNGKRGCLLIAHSRSCLPVIENAIADDAFALACLSMIYMSLLNN
jgi:Kazal-type serine protease inhibitor domain